MGTSKSSSTWVLVGVDKQAILQISRGQYTFKKLPVYNTAVLAEEELRNTLGEIALCTEYILLGH